MPGYRYNSASVVSSIIQHRCTHLMAVPVMISSIITYLEANDCSTLPAQIDCLKGIVTAGANVPEELVTNLVKVVTSIEKVFIVYGATETGPLITVPKPNETLEKSLDNVGAALDFVQVKIVDTKSGDIVKIGQKGAKTYAYTRCYYIFFSQTLHFR